MRTTTRLGVALAIAATTLTGGLGATAGGCPPPAAASSAPVWPAPPEQGAFDIVHFGEGHWNEGQGPHTMPILVADVVRQAPAFVAFSSDMADIGTPDRLECFRDVMQPLVEADIPWFDSPGNHDRLTVAGSPGGVVTEGIDPWRETFAGMPQPWGDAPNTTAGFVVPAGEPDDGPGASTHYYVDYGPPGEPAVRLIVLDNSRHSFSLSDADQYPAVGPTSRDVGQLAFLQRVAQDAADKGLLAFAMMHEPTQDPRDPSNVYPISLYHTMNKGLTPDNQAFDALAVATGVDGVLLGHILGNVVYEVGDVRYFIDGGGGGTPYALRETGTDTGYLYGYRVLRVFRDGERWTYRTYLVPLVDRIEFADVPPATVGADVPVLATAVQPYDPALPVRFPGQPNEPISVELRPKDPTRFDARTVPDVAYVYETADTGVLAPIPGPADPVDDPSFDPATMTTSGRFRAVGAGTTTVTVAVGTHSASTTVTVTG